MKAWVISDLHLEFGKPFSISPPRDADVLICAGDVLTRGIVPSIEWLATNIAPLIPVVFVAGNHEHYGGSLQEGIRNARSLRERYANVHFLENEAVDIGEVRFLGGTSWTDFRLLGRDPEIAMTVAEAGMNDFRKIKFSKKPYRRFKPIHAYRMHHETRSFIAASLAESGEWKTVVVTHHAPSPQSVPAEFSTDPLSACYASDMESLIAERRPALWVHGHIHHRADYMIGETRVIANPRGYPGEVSGFDAGLVVDI